jgi:hypothetical protein
MWKLTWTKCRLVEVLSICIMQRLRWYSSFAPATDCLTVSQCGDYNLQRNDLAIQLIRAIRHDSKGRQRLTLTIYCRCGRWLWNESCFCKSLNATKPFFAVSNRRSIAAFHEKTSNCSWRYTIGQHCPVCVDLWVTAGTVNSRPRQRPLSGAWK